MDSLEYLVNWSVTCDPGLLSLDAWTGDDFTFVFQGLPGKDGLLGRKGDKGEFGAVGLRGIKVKASVIAGNIKWISFQLDILVTENGSFVYRARLSFIYMNRVTKLPIRR